MEDDNEDNNSEPKPVEPVDPEIEKRIEKLNTRRALELELVRKFDKLEIDGRKECWFIIDTRWLKEWVSFVQGHSEPPGPLRNAELYDSATGKIHLQLIATVDYRGVPPMVWFIWKEIYGKDSSPEICRFVVDIYEAEVPGNYRKNIMEAAMIPARLEARKIKPFWEDGWAINNGDDADGGTGIGQASGPDQDDICFCFRREHLEAVIFWIFTCCRSRPKYSKYRKLDEEIEMK